MAKEHLHRGEAFTAQKDFNSALEEYQAVLALADDTCPADEALYAMGFIFAHSDNPDRDYGQAIQWFEHLAEEFPESPLADQARTWTTALTELQKKQQPVAKQTTKKKKGKKPQHQETEGEQHLRLGDELFDRKEFEQALKEYQQALKVSSDPSIGSKALYAMGLTFAHYDNPARDYKTSLEFFRMLTDSFPNSDLADQAKVWTDVLQTIEKTKQVDIEIEEKKKELTR